MAAPLQALPDFALPAGILNDERETPLDKSSCAGAQQLSSPPLGSVQSRRAAKDPSSRKTVPHQVRVPGRGGGGGHVKQNSSAFPSLNPDSDDEAAPTAATGAAAPSDASDMMMDLLSLDAEAATARQQLLQQQAIANANAAVAAAVAHHQRQPSSMAVENSFMVPQHLRRMHVSLTEQQYLAMADARSGGGGGGATGRSGGGGGGGPGRSRHDMLVNPLSPSMSQAGTPPAMCSPRSSRRAAAAAGSEFSDLSSAHLFNAVAAAAR
jgi:hypothetical protein